MHIKIQQKSNHYVNLNLKWQNGSSTKEKSCPKGSLEPQSRPNSRFHRGFALPFAVTIHTRLEYLIIDMFCNDNKALLVWARSQNDNVSSQAMTFEMELQLNWSRYLFQIIGRSWLFDKLENSITFKTLSLIMNYAILLNHTAFYGWNDFIWKIASTNFKKLVDLS